MNWFKKMVAKWVKEDWENAGNITSMEANSLIKPRRTISMGSDSIDGHVGLNITVMAAIGGKIVTFRHYDRRKDDTNYRHYVIPDELDFERELGKMITMESIRQG
jgi:hypothetical protein